MSTDPPVTYLLDTNVFIEAHRRYYAPDVCPGFWECLEHHCRAPRLLSIDRVRAEIKEGDDLHAWVKQAPGSLFASTAQPDVAAQFGTLMTWVQGNAQFSPAAKAAFAGAADGWLVAYAKVHGMLVVTHEAWAEQARRTVPIPNVCREFDVPYADTFTMLRSLQVRFGWSN